MSDVFLKWVAGIAATVAVLAGGAALTTWADVRQMKVALEEQRINAIKAERIAVLEVSVKNLETKCEHGPLWEAIRRRP